MLAPFDDGVPSPEDFVLTGAVWKYLDDGSDQGTAWYASGFNDSAWAEGPSELGYNEGDEGQLIGSVDVDLEKPGPQRNATSYFRHKVVIPNPSSFSRFDLDLLYDDGAAVYVNGVEVVRTTNLPENAAYDVYATSSTPDAVSYTHLTLPTIYSV